MKATFRRFLRRHPLVRSFWEMYQILSPPFRKRAVWGFVFLGLNSSLELVSLGALVALVPQLLNSETIPLILFFLSIVAIFGVKNLMNLWISKYHTDLAFDLFHSITTRLHQYYLQRGYLFLQSKNSSERVHNITTVSARFAQNVLMGSLMLVGEGAMLILIVGAMWIYRPMVVTLVLAVVTLPFLFFYSRMKSRMQEIHEKLNQRGAHLQETLLESFHGYANLRFNYSGSEILKKYDEQAKEVGRLLSRDSILQLIPPRLIECALVTGVGLVAVYSSWFVKDPSARLTLLSMFVLAGYRIAPSINRITMALLNLTSHRYTFPVVRKIRKGVEFSLFTQSSNKNTVLETEIVLNGIAFRYPRSTRMALQSLSFSIRKGEMMGVTGASGAGKTTLLQLLLGLLSPTQGRIFVDQTPLLGDYLRVWRESVGYVEQEVYLFDRTLAENIAMGVPTEKIQFEKMGEVLKATCLESVVARLPEGLTTRIGERGAILSVGERQRVGLARALYTDPALLLLDEITSALDSETEIELARMIRNMVRTRGMTVILATHQPSMLALCDQVVVLEEGNVKGVRTRPMELVRSNRIL